MPSAGPCFIRRAPRPAYCMARRHCSNAAIGLLVPLVRPSRRGAGRQARNLLPRLLRQVAAGRGQNWLQATAQRSKFGSFSFENKPLVGLRGPTKRLPIELETRILLIKGRLRQNQPSAKLTRLNVSLSVRRGPHQVPVTRVALRYFSHWRLSRLREKV
jgi:hypothetical protein